MRNKILIVGFACLSVMAVAQSSSPNGQASNNGAQSRDVSSGHATGKRMHDPMTTTASTSSGSAQNTSTTTKYQQGGKSTNDAWDAKTAAAAPKSSSNSPRVAAGDVNGDGKMDATASAGTQNSGNQTNNNGSSDAAAAKKKSGSIQVMKETDAASPSVASPPAGNSSKAVHVVKTTDISSPK